MNEKSPRFGEEVRKKYFISPKAKYRSKSGEIKKCVIISGRYYIPKDDI